MWKRIKKIFVGEQSANLVRKTMSTEELLHIMKQPKEIHLVTSEDGCQIATCNICKSSVNILKQEKLVWYLCEKCDLSSFNPIQNFYRDIDIATEVGGVLEHEIYYIRDTPKGFKVPHVH